MRIYKYRYKNKSGSKKALKKYWVEMRDDTGCLKRFAAFENKQTCNVLLTNIQQLKQLKQGGLEPTEKLQLWYLELPKRIQEKLVALNLIDKKWCTSNTTLLELVTNWEKHLERKGEG